MAQVASIHNAHRPNYVTWYWESNFLCILYGAWKTHTPKASLWKPFFNQRALAQA